MQNILKKIFSIKKIYAGTRIQITFLGIKIKIKPISFCLQNIISEIATREMYSAIEVSDLHKRTFPKFKNKHINDELAIVGCGPTVQYYKNELNTKNIALNAAILIDNINYTYTFAHDGGLLKYIQNYFEIIKNKELISFLGKFLEPSFTLNMPEIKYGEEYNIYRYYTSARRYLFGLDYSFESIYPNIDIHPLADYNSVSFSALHFALYTYPKKIYLIGLDTNKGGINFFEKCDGLYNTKNMLRGYQKFKEFTKMYYPETEIISVNPVGLKDIFKGVYTQSYVDAHPELLKKEIEIIK